MVVSSPCRPIYSSTRRQATVSPSPNFAITTLLAKATIMHAIIVAARRIFLRPIKRVLRQETPTTDPSSPKPSISLLLLASLVISLAPSHVHLSLESTTLLRSNLSSAMTGPSHSSHFSVSTWNLRLRQISHVAYLSWYTRYDVGGGCSSLDYEATVSDGQFIQTLPHD